MDDRIEEQCDCCREVYNKEDRLVAYMDAYLLKMCVGCLTKDNKDLIDAILKNEPVEDDHDIQIGRHIGLL